MGSVCVRKASLERTVASELVQLTATIEEIALKDIANAMLGIVGRTVGC